MWLSQVSYSPNFERDIGKYISDMRKITVVSWKKTGNWQSGLGDKELDKQERSMCLIFYVGQRGQASHIVDLLVEARNLKCNRKFIKYQPLVPFKKSKSTEDQGNLTTYKSLSGLWFSNLFCKEKLVQTKNYLHMVKMWSKFSCKNKNMKWSF